VSLERAEELCLKCLAQAKNPIVPVDTLLAHCQEDPDCAALTRGQLVGFIQKHGDMTLLEGMDMGDPVPSDWFAAAGLDMGQRAILKARVPSRDDLRLHIAAQLEAMETTLEDAKGKTEDPGRVAEIDAALARVTALKARAKTAFRGEHDNAD